MALHHAASGGISKCKDVSLKGRACTHLALPPRAIVAAMSLREADKQVISVPQGARGMCFIKDDAICRAEKSEDWRWKAYLGCGI